MEKKVCVFPGSFDPVTNGHMDLIRRGAAIFDEMIVAVLHNPAKAGKFPVEKRLELLSKACADLPNVRLDASDGLLVDYLRHIGANTVLRGLRNTSDFEMETQMAQLNRQMAPGTETLFLVTAPEYASLSSSVVREIGTFGGDLTPFVPASIVQDVATILSGHE